jgi:hypothetical protein
VTITFSLDKKFIQIHVLLASRYDLHLHRFGRASARSGRAVDFVGGHGAVFISSIAAAAAMVANVSAHLESSRVTIIFYVVDTCWCV